MECHVRVLSERLKVHLGAAAAPFFFTWKVSCKKMGERVLVDVQWISMV